MRLFRKKSVDTTTVENKDDTEVDKKSKDTGDVYPPLLHASWILSGACIALLIFSWISFGSTKYDGATFYVSDTVVPDIAMTDFVENNDGTYTAKLLGLFSMGNCRIEQVSRPRVELMPYALICTANADYPVIRGFMYDGCNAEKAGMHVGDYIVAVNGHKLSNIDWQWGAYASKLTEDTRFDIIRNNEELTIYCKQSSKDGMFGINYSPQELQLGTISMIDRSIVTDYVATMAIGHNVVDNLYSECSKIIGLKLSDDSLSVEPVFLDDSLYTTRGLITLKQDNYGIISAFSDDFLTQLKLTGMQFETEQLDIAWNWEISTTDSAFVLLALDGVTDNDGRRLYTPVPVNISAFNGQLLDVFGNEINGCHFTISALSDTYKLSIDMLKDSGAVFADDYSVHEDTPVRFLNGMSGSPVIQNGRIIGVLTSVDVTDSTKAYITDAESVYMNYYNFITDTGDVTNG